MASGSVSNVDARKRDGSAMSPRLEQLKESLESAVDGMSSQQVSWHLPGKWWRHTKLLDHPILGPLTVTQWRKLHLVRHAGKQRLSSEGPPIWQ